MEPHPLKLIFSIRLADSLDLQQRLWSTLELGGRKKMENIEKWILQFVPDVEAVFVLLVIRDMECSNWPPQHTLLRCLLGPAWLGGLFELLSSSRKMKGAALAAPDRHGEIKEPRLVIVMIVIITKLLETRQPRLALVSWTKQDVCSCSAILTRNLTQHSGNLPATLRENYFSSQTTLQHDTTHHM